MPEPLLPVAVVAKSKADEDKLSQGIGRLVAEDPTLRLEMNSETHQLVLWCMGEAHLDVLLDRLKNRYGVDVESVPVRVQLRETFAGAGVRARAAREAVRWPWAVRRVRHHVEPLRRVRVRVRRQGRRRRRAAAVHPLGGEGRPTRWSTASPPAIPSSTSASRSTTASPTPSTPPTWPSRPPGPLALREAAKATQVHMLEPVDEPLGAGLGRVRRRDHGRPLHPPGPRHGHRAQGLSGNGRSFTVNCGRQSARVQTPQPFANKNKRSLIDAWRPGLCAKIPASVRGGDYARRGRHHLRQHTAHRADY